MSSYKSMFGFDWPVDMTDDNTRPSRRFALGAVWNRQSMSVEQ